MSHIWEKIFEMHVSDRRLIARTYKEILPGKKKKKAAQLKIRQAL